MHELATNAIGFGARSADAGHLVADGATAGDADGENRLDVLWVGGGVPGLAETLPRRGFGSEVIERALLSQLAGEGRLTLERDGMRCRIRVLLPGPQTAA